MAYVEKVYHKVSHKIYKNNEYNEYGMGELKSEVFVNNGKREGVYKEYYNKDNMIFKICNYTDGKLNGPYNVYYYGDLVKECVYNNDKLISCNLYYPKQNGLHASLISSDDNKTKWKIYYINEIKEILCSCDWFDNYEDTYKSIFNDGIVKIYKCECESKCESKCE